MMSPTLLVLGGGGLLLLGIAIGWVLGRARGSRDLLAPPRVVPPRATTPVDLDPARAAELRGLVAARRRIEAIKRLRAATGLGLAEAKDRIERL